MKRTEQVSTDINASTIAIGLIAAIVLFFISRQNYLLFHSISEVFSIVVACGIFMFSWNSRKIIENDYLVFLGIAYLFIGCVDVLHTLAYKGMGVFIEHDANLPTQFWIIGRYIESLSLLIAPMFLRRKINFPLIFFGYFGIILLLLLSVFLWNIFPACFVEGVGLTPFKKNSEYIISLILFGAMVLLFQNRNEFDQKVFRLIVTSIILTICAELAFTFYVSVFGLSNLVGHYLKIISYFLIYTAIINTGLRDPYSILFRKLKQSETKLLQSTKELQLALDEVKTLKGIIPICSYCKKIRDDKGAWDIVEAYICEHTDAEFSHGVCPDCKEKMMKEMGLDD